MHMEKKIGITTYYRYNYGSILQCYATCETLKKCGYVPEVMDIRSGKMKTLLSIVSRCMAHPAHIREFFALWKAQRASSLSSLSSEGLALMERFVAQYIPVNRLKKPQLESIGSSHDYCAFLSGSDQIWNGHHFLVSPHYFLSFAPKNKRIAWAPSFGTSDIAVYNRKLYRKYISQYSALSVRETKGIQLIKELTNITPIQLIDPVFLLKGDEWVTLTQGNAYGRYALCYFLNDPREETIRQIAEYCAKEQMIPIVFGSKRDVYCSLGKYQAVDGGPAEFLSMIRHTQCLFTDSFHGISFAMILHTPFYAYKRNYTHGVDQSSRLHSILQMCHMEAVFEPQQLNVINYAFDYAEAVIAEKRAEMLDYLRKALENAKKEVNCESESNAKSEK